MTEPAFFAPIKEEWLTRAIEHLKQNDRLYFYTGGNVGGAQTLPIKHVYFKTTKTSYISAKADLIEIVTENPASYRLPESKNTLSKYYYGFKNLRLLSNKVDLVDSKYFTTGSSLRNDIPGAAVISDPGVE